MNLPIRKYFLILGKACNLRCIYCHQGEDKPVYSDSVDIAPSDVARYFPTEGEYKIVFYGGEPLLYFDSFVAIAEAIKERNPQALLSTITNGTLLTVRRAKILNELGITVGVSHDGKFFEQTRGVRDFLKVNPDPFLTLERRNVGAVTCRVNYNFYDVWDYFDEFKQKHGLPSREYVHIQVVKDVEGNTAEQLLIKDMPEFEKMLDTVFSRLGTAIKECNWDRWEFRQYQPMLQTMHWRLNSPGRPMGAWCGADTQVCHIDVAGNLYPCHNVPVPNGHVSKSGPLAGEYNPFVTDPKCTSCPAYVYCGGGCPVSSPENRGAMCYTVYQQVTRLLSILEDLKGDI